jgi:hypothetical protein
MTSQAIGQATTVTEAARRTDVQHFRVVMIFLAVGSVLAGFLLGLLHHRLHLSAEEARDVASLFLVVGVADTLVLYHWDRIFRT